MDINRGFGAGLIRLVFHDCFVRGCDGSVLLDSTPKNTTSDAPLTLAGKTEKASPNNGGLRGLEVIDAIRLRLAEKGGRAGRKDGVVSSAEDPGKHLPNPTDNFQQLLQSFMAKGFNLVELVALSGAHSVGVANLTPGAAPNNVRDFDDSNRKLAGYQANGVVDLTAVGYLDNSYYNANFQNMVLFNSDWELTTNETAKLHMTSYKEKASLWNTAFADAMTKLSKMVESKDPLYEIGSRRTCNVTNQMSYP
uniref:Peroxidase 2 n=1 Tax=Aegilops tauschii TaxID=37682 RepID=N1R2E1_AEGTA